MPKVRPKTHSAEALTKPAKTPITLKKSKSATYGHYELQKTKIKKTQAPAKSPKLSKSTGKKHKVTCPQQKTLSAQPLTEIQQRFSVQLIDYLSKEKSI